MARNSAQSATLRHLLTSPLRSQAVRRLLIRSAWFRRAYGIRIYWDWNVPHPFDAAYGIDTSGRLAEDELRARLSAVAADALLSRDIVAYIPSQPSIVRRALQCLPEPSGYGFVDIGCGKGRALIVASEFPFARIVGVEIAPELVAVAQANAAIIAGKFPERPRIEVLCGDATRFHPPARKLVVYIYHSFGAELMQRLCDHLAALIGHEVDHLFLIYYNPLCADVFDASPALSRWSATEFAYDPSEHGFGPNRADTVAIWQSRHNALPPVQPGRDRAIVVGGYRQASLAPA